MTKISVTIPCYNDSNSIISSYERITKVFAEQLPQYDYEIIYVDDCSPDDGKTWSEIKKVCSLDKQHCKGVRNVRNFGFYRNVFATLQYGTGDATFMLFGDMQDPPEILPEFVRHWEDGYCVVVGQRLNSYNPAHIRVARKAYYKAIGKLSHNQQIEGVCGFGLYDKSFLKTLGKIDDIQPVLPGIITEYARNVKIVPVTQEKDNREKINLNFWGRYDIAMASITSYSKTLLRVVTFFGAVIGMLSALYGLYIVVYKIIHWDTFSSGIPSLMAGMFFLGAIQLFFLGVLGEYVLSINNRSMKRPIVVVDEKINFDEHSDE